MQLFSPLNLKIDMQITSVMWWWMWDGLSFKRRCLVGSNPPASPASPASSGSTLDAALRPSQNSCKIKSNSIQFNSINSKSTRSRGPRSPKMLRSTAPHDATRRHLAPNFTNKSKKAPDADFQSLSPWQPIPTVCK